MTAQASLTLVGNLTADPELRITSTGDAYATFTIASTPRVLDRVSGQWRDGDTLYLRCTAWRQLAEHLAASLHRGTRVWVQGNLKQRSFETSDGDKRTTVELDVDEIGPSLRFATATVHRAPRRTDRDRAGEDAAADGHTPAA